MENNPNKNEESSQQIAKQNEITNINTTVNPPETNSKLNPSANINSSVSAPVEVEQTVSSRSRYKTLIVLGILVLLLSGSLIFSFYQGLFNSFFKTSSGSMTDQIENNESIDKAGVDPSASASAVLINDLRVKVTNGTGITGQANKTEELLSSLQVKEILVNPEASKGGSVTRVGFDPNVPEDVRAEVKNKLATLFSEVEEYEATDTGEFDLLILTGEEK